MSVPRILALIALGGCVPAGQVTYSDQGVACVGGVDGPLNVLANRPLDLQIALAADPHCEADVLDTVTTCDWDGGSNIDVHASARLVPFSADASCATLIDARCDTEPLPAGTYTVHYAGQSVTVTLPSSITDNCTGDWPAGT
jgi:hypothetical protein